MSTPVGPARDGTIVVARGARHHVPGPERAEPFAVTAPPSLDGDATGWGQALVPFLGSLGMLLLLGRSGDVMTKLAMGFMVVGGLAGSVAMHAGMRRRTSRRQAARRRRWQQHLAAQTALAVQAAGEQRARALRTHPDDLAAVASGALAGRWERRPGDADALALRVGIGAVPAERPVTGERNGPLDETDAELVTAAAEASDHSREVAGVPVAVDLRTAGPLAVVGPTAPGRALLRRLVAEACTACPPDELALAVVTDAPVDWAWVAWLPHARLGTQVFVNAGVPAGRCLVVVDGGQAPVEQPGQVRLVRADAGAAVPSVGAWVDVTSGTLVEPGCRVPVVVDGLSVGAAEQVARALAPLRWDGQQLTSRAASSTRLSTLLGLAAPGTDPLPARRRSPLTVPLGVDPAGATVHLDLREAAFGGSGPHGLLVGATGSGKSELLRSLVLGLAATHSPAELAVLLVDFKGGAGLGDLAGLPHCAGMLTNLAETPDLVERVEQALLGELERRQRALRDAGVGALSELPGLLPSLLVVIDEFGELLAARPEMLDVLGSIGRVGRSLGVHLLLCSQRLEEGRLRGLESHLRYRLCLRTYSAQESVAVLGVPDAATLPPRPGVGFLAVDGARTRLDVAYASAAVVGLSRRALVRSFGAMVTEPTLRPAATGEGSELTVLLGRLAGGGRTRQVWHEPLPARVPAVVHSGGPLQVCLGLVDLPRAQAVTPWTLDLADPLTGAVAVVGAARSGRSGFLRAVAAGVGDGVRLAVVDPALSLEDLAALPACWSWVTSQARALALLRSLLVPQQVPVVLLVDDVDHLEDLTGVLAQVAAAGLRNRVHVVVTAPRWGDLRGGLRDVVTTRLELRLNDAGDSMAARGAQARLRRAPAGRLVTSDGAEVQVVHARVAVPAAAESCAAAGPGPVGADLSVEEAGERARVRVERRPELPAFVAAAAPARIPGALVLGPCEPALTPFELPATGHLVVVGERGSGRTTLLRRIAEAWAAPDRAVTVVDPRRTLVGLATGSRAWAGSTPDAAATVAALAAAVAQRAWRPGMDHSARWWSGAEHLLVVDDADLLGGHGLLAPLLDLLAQGDELGLRVVLARRSAGWQRSAYDGVLTALRESGATHLLLPGDPAEGPVVGGVRMAAGPVGRALVVDAGGEVTTVQLARETVAPPVELAAQRLRRAS